MFQADTAQRYLGLRAEVDRVCQECGRDPRGVMLVAVSKTVGPDAVREAAGVGALDFGENRPDSLLEKYEAYPQARWHFIGNVQSRRIPDIVAHSYLIHSVYKMDHFAKIDAAAKAVGKIQNVLLEINSGEEAKGGIAPDQAYGVLGAARRLPNVRLCGLMTMAPLGGGQQARECFARLRALHEDIVLSGVVDDNFFTEISAGMTDDWPEAVAEGATILRVGRAIFSS